MNFIKAVIIFVLMIIAAITDNRKMQTWLDGIIWNPKK